MIEELKGKTLSSVHVEGNDLITFKCTDGSEYRMFHEQDCCESVTINDINGDWDDILGVPIMVAEERTSNLPLQSSAFIDPEESDSGDSFTWTFYHLRTFKGSVDIRWYGTSNGYYSESVSFEKFNGYDNEDNI